MRPPATGFNRVAAGAVAVAVLCLPAIWNGFPLVFDDVGGYLERWPTASLAVGRSATYGLLLWFTAPLWWIPVIVLQAVLTVWVIDRALAIFGVGRSPWMTAAITAAIAATSGAALFVSKVMPDAWAAPAVLALHLLAWHADRLTRIERAAMAMIIALAGAFHMATFAVLGGLSIMYTAAWLGRRRLGVAPTGLNGANAAVWSGLALLLAIDLLVSGRFALTPGGDLMLFGHLVEDGMVGRVLAEECPRDDWRLCAYRNDLPGYSEAFIWDADSPLREIGGWDDPRAKREIRSIIARSVVTHPLDHLVSAAALTARQFVSVGILDDVAPLMSVHPRWVISQHAPWLLARFDAARQQAGDVDLTRWSGWIVSPISIIASFALPVLALTLWRQNQCCEAMLPAMLVIALVGNAFVCGTIPGPNDRYQARLAWLAPLAVVMAWPSPRKKFADRHLAS